MFIGLGLRLQSVSGVLTKGFQAVGRATVSFVGAQTNAQPFSAGGSAAALLVGAFTSGGGGGGTAGEPLGLLLALTKAS